MATFKIKQNDTAPSLNVTLAQNDTVVSLVGAAVMFHMKDDINDTVLVEGTAVVLNATLGTVRYDWIAADTALAGCFPAEFEVTFADDSVESFPNDSNLTIIITEDLA